MLWYDEEGTLHSAAYGARVVDHVVEGDGKGALQPEDHLRQGITHQDEVRSGFADAILLSVGRPVLVLPYAGDAAVKADNVLVCWDAGREAARAVTDALPLLRRAKRVTVLSVDSRASAGGHGEQPGADIALYLSRHGIKAEAARTTSGGIDPGSVILSRAFDYGADLIVMGAYGHSRLRELVLGGATREIFRSMTVPVFLSH